jgi:hypothetical protein
MGWRRGRLKIFWSVERGEMGFGEGETVLPTPLDFKYALAEFDLPIASIEPYLQPPIPRSKLLVQLEALPVEELPTSPAGILFGEELSGELDKKQKRWEHGSGIRAFERGVWREVSSEIDFALYFTALAD